MENINCWYLYSKIVPLRENIMLVGPPGVGKSYAAIHLSGRSIDQISSITLTEQTDSIELRGHYIRGQDGNFHWHDGPATKAWRSGGLLIINELGSASGDVLSYLMSVLDDKAVARITLPSGETITPDKNFQVIATSNISWTDIPPALQDRFPVKIVIDQLLPPQHDTQVNIFKRAAATAFLEQGRSVSLRTWLAFERLVGVVGLEFAALAVFGDRANDLIVGLELKETPEK